MRYIRRTIPLLAMLVGAGIAGALAQVKQKQDEEGKIKAAAFAYYSSTVFGEIDDLLKVARHPLTIVKDGAVSRRDLKQSRALLTSVAEKMKEAGVKNEDRGRILGNMIGVFDDSSVQFVGARTAHLTFVMRFGTQQSGDSLGTLLVHRLPDGAWKVIGEITDSAPVPPSYLLEVP